MVPGRKCTTMDRHGREGRDFGHGTLPRHSMSNNDRQLKDLFDGPPCSTVFLGATRSNNVIHDSHTTLESEEVRIEIDAQPRTRYTQSDKDSSRRKKKKKKKLKLDSRPSTLSEDVVPTIRGTLEHNEANLESEEVFIEVHSQHQQHTQLGEEPPRRKKKSKKKKKRLKHGSRPSTLCGDAIATSTHFADHGPHNKDAANVESEEVCIEVQAQPTRTSDGIPAHARPTSTPDVIPVYAQPSSTLDVIHVHEKAARRPNVRRPNVIHMGENNEVHLESEEVRIEVHTRPTGTPDVIPGPDESNEANVESEEVCIEVQTRPTGTLDVIHGADENNGPNLESEEVCIETDGAQPHHTQSDKDPSRRKKKKKKKSSRRKKKKAGERRLKKRTERFAHTAPQCFSTEEAQPPNIVLPKSDVAKELCRLHELKRSASSNSANAAGLGGSFSSIVMPPPATPPSPICIKRVQFDLHRNKVHRLL